MTIIKHIVFTGGGPVGLVEYGALKYLTEKKFIAHENIESLYTISIGGIIGLIYILNFEWAWMDDFLIKRPWNKLFNITYSSYINILYEKGIINKTFLITSAPNCGAVREEREPPKDPTAVRTAPVITTSLSFIFFYFSFLL